MRSIFLNDFNPNLYSIGTPKSDILLVADEMAFHLIIVCRIKLLDQVMILNGDGTVAISEVQEINRKKVSLKLLKIKNVARNLDLDFLIAPPKKDAFDLMLKMAVELGVHKINLISSEYSQINFKSNARYERLIESAMIQSNNPYKLKIGKQFKLTDCGDVLAQYDHIFYFCSHQLADATAPIKLQRGSRVLIIIGPEGGFSQKEEELFKTFKAIHFINLSAAYIMRSPTALATAYGHVLSYYDNIY